MQNVSERQILWSLCSVDYHTFTLKLPIQTSLSLANELPVCARSGEQVCIPVGCVTPALPASTVLGGVSSRDGGLVLGGGLLSQHVLRQTPPCEQND